MLTQKLDQLNENLPNIVILQVKQEITQATSHLKNEIVVGVAKAVMSPVVVDTISD